MESGILNQELGKIRNFFDLDAWKEGQNLVIFAYRVTKSFPREELYALVDQIKRAAVSIVSNIAEGFGRATYKDKVYFYVMANGSV